MFYIYKTFIYMNRHVLYRNIEFWIFSVYFQITLQNFYKAKNIEKSRESLKSKRNRWDFSTLTMRSECSTHIW